MSTRDRAIDAAVDTLRQAGLTITDDFGICIQPGPTVQDEDDFHSRLLSLGLAEYIRREMPGTIRAKSAAHAVCVETTEEADDASDDAEA